MKIHKIDAFSVIFVFKNLPHKTIVPPKLVFFLTQKDFLYEYCLNKKKNNLSAKIK